LITPFIDPLTREKLKFNEDMKQYVPREQLWTEFSEGDLQFDYDHAEYWPALMKLCQEKRDAKRERWIAGGKLIGEHEDYLAGGEDKGLAASSAVPAAPAAAGEAVTKPDAPPAVAPEAVAPAS
ncbi:hypothetical protein ACHAO5_009292, partial [Verticillium nonalfalfae]